MRWITSLFLITLLFGCSKNHDQNDPYTLEETEVEYVPPEPYYEDEYDR